MRVNATRTLTAVAGIAAALVTGAAAPSVDAARLHAAITSPTRGATLAGTVPFTARVTGHATRVRFLVDGKNFYVARPKRALARFLQTGTLDTIGLANGKHRLTLVVQYKRRVVRTTITVRVSNPRRGSGRGGSGHTGNGDGNGNSDGSGNSNGNGNGSGIKPAPTPPTSATLPQPPLPPGSPLWSDGFESGDFTGWEWWGQGDPSWGHIGVVSGGVAGAPVAPQGTRIARFETTPDDIANGRENAKLYQGFYTGGPSVMSRRSPVDVSGTYRVLYYFPTTYTVPHGTAVNVFQFKERYRTSSGDAPSDPLWWVQLGDAAWARSMGGPAYSRPDAPVAFISFPTNNFTRPMHYVPVPLGRWVEFRADVHQNDRIDFYIDGTLLDTGHASEYPVSPLHGSNSLEWTFGIGNYSGGANGPLYADSASYTPGP